MDDRIDLEIAPALETLRALPQDPVIDLVFLDADKPGYRAYWDELVPRLSPGGLILADNVLYGERRYTRPRRGTPWPSGSSTRTCAPTSGSSR